MITLTTNPNTKEAKTTYFMTDEQKKLLFPPKKNEDEVRKDFIQICESSRVDDQLKNKHGANYDPDSYQIQEDLYDLENLYTCLNSYINVNQNKLWIDTNYHFLTFDKNSNPVYFFDFNTTYSINDKIKTQNRGLAGITYNIGSDDFTLFVKNKNIDNESINLDKIDKNNPNFDFYDLYCYNLQETLENKIGLLVDTQIVKFG
jgi:hypothetical protein